LGEHLKQLRLTTFEDEKRRAAHDELFLTETSNFYPK
jgi:hypothetical protein